MLKRITPVLAAALLLAALADTSFRKRSRPATRGSAARTEAA
jgi:hypothetical protein